MSKQHCRSNRQLCCLLLRQCCRFGQQCRSNVRLCRKDEISTQNSFDIVAVFGNKVERCIDIVAKNGNNVEATFDIVAFDIVAGVDRALPNFLCMLLMAVARSSSGKVIESKGKKQFWGILPRWQCIVQYNIWDPYKTTKPIEMLFRMMRRLGRGTVLRRSDVGKHARPA